MMQEVVRDTATLSLSIIGGPSAASIARKVAQSSDEKNRLGVLGPQTSPAALIGQIREIARQGAVDQLVLECDPGQPIMAYASLFQDDGDGSLADVAHLQTAAVAVAPAVLLDLLMPGRSSAPANSICFFVEQLEFANEILFEDNASDSDHALASAVAHALNPRAGVERFSPTSWPRRKGERFEFASALNSAEWRRLIDDEPAPVTYEHGIAAFAYHARKPFHPERLWNLLQKDLRNVFRAKGFFWLATRMDLVGGLNLAGSELHAAPAGQWWATHDLETRQREMPERTRREYQEPFGDRRQAIAILTHHADQNLLQTQLDGCLLTESEMRAGPESWNSLPDPFPSWSLHHHHHDEECDHHDHEQGCGHDHGSAGHDCCQH
jgi:G3E family GTPase